MTLFKRDVSKLNHKNGAMLVLDLCISVLASAAAILLIRWMQHAVLHFQTYFLLWLASSVIASVISFLAFGTHKVVILHATIRSVGNLFYATLLKEGILLVCALTNLSGIRQFESTRILLFSDFTMTLVMLVSIRLTIIEVTNYYKKNLEEEIDKLSVMVFGTSDKSVSMVTRLDQSKRFNICGFLSRDSFREGQIVADYKVYLVKDENSLEELKVSLGFESILFSTPADVEEEKDGLITMCLHKGINVLLTPKIESINYGGMSPRAIKSVVDNEFIPDGMTGFERNTKRVLDLLLSAILIVACSPLFLICWLAIKIGDGGPALYHQERIGRFGRPFMIHKFRSMRLDAESGGPALYSGDKDTRLTKVGGFLRIHHLDELPQLWNVFCGEMAFVGYRPERKVFIDRIMEKDPRYYYLYQIRPGVTSYATLRNGYTDSLEKMLRRLEFDLYYLRHRSWWFDITVLWHTFLSIAFGKKF